MSQGALFSVRGTCQPLSSNPLVKSNNSHVPKQGHYISSASGSTWQERSIPKPNSVQIIVTHRRVPEQLIKITSLSQSRVFRVLPIATVMPAVSPCILSIALRHPGVAHLAQVVERVRCAQFLQHAKVRLRCPSTSLLEHTSRKPLFGLRLGAKRLGVPLILNIGGTDSSRSQKWGLKSP